MVSAVILTHNSQETILRSVNNLSWCDEIIIIDDFSTDNTKKIASSLNVKFVTHALNNDYANQRNYALSLTQNDWVFFVDDDETVSKELAQEIKNVVITNNADGYFMPRKDIFYGKELKFGETAHIKLLRLAKKNKGKWIGKVHEIWQISGKTKNLSNAIYHYSHPSIREFVNKINYYSTLRANELQDAGIEGKVIDILIYPFGKFILNYFIKLGFRDGVRGTIMAIMMSFHSYLVRSKLYVLTH